MIAARLAKNKNSNKLYSFLVLPMVIGPLESQFDDERIFYRTEEEIIIYSDNKDVWSYLIEVPEITSEEYKDGFFQFVGIPRPVKSQMKVVNQDTFRIGYFTDEFILCESLSRIKTNELVSFNIHLEKSKLRDTPTDQHILKSDNFQFEGITYELNSLSQNRTALTLSCDYSIESKMNWYGYFWANIILSDFEERLLKALKVKIEYNAKKQ